MTSKNNKANMNSWKAAIVTIAIVLFILYMVMLDMADRTNELKEQIEEVINAYSFVEKDEFKWEQPYNYSYEDVRCVILK